MITTDDLKRDFGAEISVIILACRIFVGTAEEGELKSLIATTEIDWPLLYKTATIHQVRPILFRVLFKFDIPADIKGKLQADAMHIAFHNLEHAKELVKIHGLLDDVNVRAIPYKGSVYCLEYYKDIGLREFSDIDFLIEPDAAILDKIKPVFEGLGYIDKSCVPDDFKDIQLKYTREYYFDLYKNDLRKFHAEFHWSTASQVFDFPTPLPNTLLFEDLRDSEIYGYKIKILNDTHHFIAMATHHGLNQQWNLMKYVMDLGVILKNGTQLNWSEINATSKTYGFNKAINIGLYIADQLLGLKADTGREIPKDARQYLDKLLTPGPRKRKGTAETLVQNLKIKDDLASKAKMVTKYIGYAATPSILDYKFLRLPKGLYFLYLFVKPVRFLAESLGKDAH